MKVSAENLIIFFIDINYNKKQNCKPLFFENQNVKAAFFTPNLPRYEKVDIAFSA